MDDEDDDLQRRSMSSPSARRFRSACRTWTCRPGSTTCEADLSLISDLIASMDKVGPEDDAKLQHLKDVISAQAR